MDIINFVIYVFCSSFADIFDVDHFINVLKDELRIVTELPTEYAWSTRDYYATGIRATRIKTAPTHASAEWYVENVLPVIHRFVAFLTQTSFQVNITLPGEYANMDSPLFFSFFYLQLWHRCCCSILSPFGV